MTPGRNIVPPVAPAPLRPDDVARLKMNKANEDCSCLSIPYAGTIRFCAKHRPVRVGTHGRMTGRA